MLQNLRVKYVGGRLWQRWWSGHAGQLLPGVRAEIERESERLSLVQAQIRTIEAEQRQAVAADAEPQVVRLAQLRAIGIGSGWVLVKELFGWRRFHNRREWRPVSGLLPRPTRAGRAKPSKAFPRPAIGECAL